MIESIKYTNSIFEQPRWLDLVAPGTWQEATVKDDDGEILARLPYVKEKDRLVMPPFTQNLGIWMRDDVKADYGRQKKIISDLLTQIGPIKRCDIYLSCENEYVLPFRWHGMSISPNFTYRLDDLSDLDRIYSFFNKTAKKNIKYASHKVSLTYDYNKEHLYAVVEKTYRKQNRKVPFDLEKLDLIISKAIENGFGKYIEAVDADGNIHACSFFLYDEKVCYYLISASDSEFSKSGAQSLILWDAIQFAATKSEIFDFEGSMIEGIENFFRQFGGRCVPYYSIKKMFLFESLFDIMKPRIKRMIGYKI